MSLGQTKIAHLSSNSAGIAYLDFSGVSRKPADKAFAIQYTALILLILTFIIGSFFNKEFILQTKSEAIKQLEIAEPKETQIGDLRYSDLFNQRSSQIDQDKMDALVSLLSNHDVTLVATINTLPEEVGSGADPLTLALSRSISVQRYLLDKGVSPETFSVFASAAVSHDQAIVQFKEIQAAVEVANAQ